MSDTRDSMPAADAMPQPGEHSFNTKPRDEFAEKGADEPTMSTADQEAEKQKEFDKIFQKINAELLALSKRKLEAEAQKAEQELEAVKEKRKAEAQKAEQELQAVEEKRKADAAQTVRDAKLHEAKMETTYEERELAQEMRKIDVPQALANVRITAAKAEELEVENKDKTQLLAKEAEVLYHGTPKEKLVVLERKVERDKETTRKKMAAEHYEHEIKNYQARSEETRKLNNLIVETKEMTKDFESNLKNCDSIISGLIPKVREYNTLQAETRDAEIVHLDKKVKRMREMSFPVGTRVKAIMDRYGYRMGKIIGFSGDLFQVKFDYPPDKLFQDTAFEHIKLYEPAPEPKAVDDAVLDDADL